MSKRSFYVKYPISGVLGCPIAIARSRSMLDISQLVSGKSVHAWQAAKFSEFSPCPELSMHKGSEEQKRPFSRAAFMVEV